MIRRTTVALTVTALTAATFVASAPAGAAQGQRHGDHDKASTVYTLDDSTHGNPEGVASRGRYFYVGATGDGTIYRGTLGDPTVHTFIPGVAGRSAVGMKTSGHWLYVAGGSTGTIFVYNLQHPGAAPLTFDTGAGGFLNDLVVTARGDVYVTDSFRPTLWRIAADQVKPHGMVDGISVSPDIPYTANAFNLNGIVSLGCGRELIVVNTADGKLYRIRFDRRGNHRINVVDAPPLVGGDGMLVDKGKLVVVRGDDPTTPEAFDSSLTFLRLRHHHSAGEIRAVVKDPALRGSSTVARLHDRYLVVNADFGTSTRPFTVAGLARRD